MVKLSGEWESAGRVLVVHWDASNRSQEAELWAQSLWLMLQHRVMMMMMLLHMLVLITVGVLVLGLEGVDMVVALLEMVVRDVIAGLQNVAAANGAVVSPRIRQGKIEAGVVLGRH